MSTLQLSDNEKQLATYDFAKLSAQADAAKAKIATATTAADLKTEICSIWSKIKPFVGILEKLPFVGKFITILAEILDAVCAAA
jgi:hypothetical protein